jgi:glycerophosphoryl diester phosphodiesterase
MNSFWKKFPWIIIAIVLAITLIILLSNLLARPGTDRPFFQQFDKYPLVIAHADDEGLGLAPGNTHLFLETAAELGVDVLEMDVHLTTDGHVVLIHDETVDRTTDGSGRVSGLTLEEIQSLEVGINWTPDGGANYPFRGSGLRIPTLEEVFRAFPTYPMNIEIKADSKELALELCGLIDDFGMTDRVLVASSRDMAMRRFREACPQVATSANKGEVTQSVLLGYALLANPVKPAYQAYQVPERSSGITIMRPGFVQAAHRRNLQVHVWTVDDPNEMMRYIDMGVDGILTNKPGPLLEMLGRGR